MTFQESLRQRLSGNSLYHVCEIFYSLQGEGARAGWPAVFCRFVGCNLWSGREKDRKDAKCAFCDTAFLEKKESGGTFNAQELAEKINALWLGASHKYVILTGGEPLLQLDPPLIQALHEKGFEIGIETNGTLKAPDGIDWICVSPKVGTRLVQTSGQEIKVVIPQMAQNLSDYEHLDFEHFYLQPMDGENKEKNTQEAIKLCLNHPQWKLSVQLHKYLNID